jgi:MFS transporter, CP family, cyanate transporter
VRHSDTSGPASVPHESGRRPQGSPGRGRDVVLLIAGIMVLAISLRAAIASLPPVFPDLSAALHLSSASISVLAAVPVLCFGLFSGLAAPLSRGFGEERMLLAALLLLAGGLLLRGALPGAMLFPGTVLAGGAIALMNVLLPSLVKRRRPEQAGLLIGSYLLMLSGGAVVASLIAVPVFQAAGGVHAAGGWAVKLTLGMWALPALAAAVVWLPQTRYRTRPDPAVPDTTTPAAGRGGRLAVHRHALAWQVAAFMGLQSMVYYASLSWLPTMFQSRGVTATAAGGLLALMNLGNAVTAMLMPVLAHRARDQRLLVTITVLATATGLAGTVFAPTGGAAFWTLLLGLGQGASLGLGIFFTMARAPDPAAAASLSAFAQSSGYMIAAAGPLAVGFLHAATGGWTVPVLALLGVAALMQWAGLLAGRARTLPRKKPGEPGEPAPHPARIE